MPIKVKKQFFENPDIVNIHEAATYMKLSTSYLYKLVQKKKIPHIRAGYKILFNKADLDKWIEEKYAVVHYA